MIKIRKSKIVEMAKERPYGYIDEVFAAAKARDREFLYFDWRVYSTLFKKYRGEVHQRVPEAEVKPHIRSGGGSIKEKGRKCWEALHSLRQLTQQILDEWLETVPGFDCQCKTWAIEYITANTPPFGGSPEDVFEWGFHFHDAADEKTGDQRMTLEQAKAYWGR